MKYTVAMILNTAIFAIGGYAYGYHVGYNQPKLDQAAVEKAVFEAIFFEQALDICARCTILIV